MFPHTWIHETALALNFTLCIWGQPLTVFGNKCSSRFALMIIVCMALSIHWVAPWRHLYVSNTKYLYNGRTHRVTQTYCFPCWFSHASLPANAGRTASLVSAHQHALPPDANRFRLCPETHDVQEVVSWQGHVVDIEHEWFRMLISEVYLIAPSIGIKWTELARPLWASMPEGFMASWNAVNASSWSWSRGVWGVSVNHSWKTPKDRGPIWIKCIQVKMLVFFGSTSIQFANLVHTPIPLHQTIRKWISELEGYMPSEKRAQLKRELEESGFQMVNTYQDKNGHTRVWQS